MDEATKMRLKMIENKSRKINKERENLKRKSVKTRIV